MKLVATNEKVQIKWFVWTMGEKFPHTANMRGNWGWDAQCSCGWETRSGGATKTCIENDVQIHKMVEHDYTYELSLAEIIGA
jgi:hypothetical protein